jgi:integrase
MASLKFRIKTDKEWNSLYIRMKQGKQFDIELSTGIQVPKGRWSDKKQQILSTNELDYITVNLKLREFESYINKEFQSSKLDEQIISNKWLREKIGLFFNRETKNPDLDSKIFLSNYITQFIEESRSKRSRKNTTIKPRTIQHYNTTLTKVLEYEASSRKRLKLLDMNLQFHQKFIDFLENQQFLNPNTIGGYIDDIKLFCSNADKKGIGVSKDYKLSEFFSPSNETNDIYLNLDEIQSIYEKIFTQDYLDNARDWFIIGLWTGLRVSDLLGLKQSDIVDGFIYNTNERTEYPAIIPINYQVQAILDKRAGEFPRKISDQKFNLYIKEVCKESGLTEKVTGAKKIQMEVEQSGKKVKIFRKHKGIYPKYELVSSHTCRRSFATNLYGKIDTLTIMKVTGHKTESQFLSYIKITPIEYAQKLMAHWIQYFKAETPQVKTVV